MLPDVASLNHQPTRETFPQCTTSDIWTPFKNALVSDLKKDVAKIFIIDVLPAAVAAYGNKILQLTLTSYSPLSFSLFLLVSLLLIAHDINKEFHNEFNGEIHHRLLNQFTCQGPEDWHANDTAERMFISQCKYPQNTSSTQIRCNVKSLDVHDAIPTGFALSARLII